MKDVDPTYRLRVNVNGFAIISCGYKTANIYVKKLHSYKIPTSPLHIVRTIPTDSVMMKLEFCNGGDLCSFISPTTMSPLQSLYKLRSFFYINSAT